MRNLLVSYLEQQKELYGDVPFHISTEEIESFFSEDIDTPIQEIQVKEPPVYTKTHTSLDALNNQLQQCRACGLCEQRSHVVFGSGNPNADLMIIGEAPGAEEDKQGLPFVGKAGQLLTKMLSATGFSREEVYIANIVKCRPPNNRDPEQNEKESCLPFLKQQIQFVQPKMILSLGRISGQTLTDISTSLSKLRGQFYTYENIELLVTYHPAALLRNPQWKKPVWDDLKKLRYRIDQLKNV